MSEVLKGRAHPLPGINAGASRAPCFLVISAQLCGRVLVRWCRSFGTGGGSSAVCSASLAGKCLLRSPIGPPGHRRKS
jgi:hypothetical protein